MPGQLIDYFAMGGYAAFVWPAYALALLMLGGLLWASLRSLRRNERLLSQLNQGTARRRSRAVPESRPRMDEPESAKP